MTQASVNEAVNSVLRFNGQRIAFPDGRYYNECTAVIAWYMQALQLPLPPMHNARADGWGIAHPTELLPYFTFEPYTPGKAYPFGTIMMWDSPHIAIVLSSDGSNMINVFEQNADPDHSPCEIINRVVNNSFHHATAVMIPIIDVQAPVIPYTITHIDPRQLVVTNGCKEWDLSRTDWDSIVANPVSTAGDNKVITINAELHTTVAPQYTYYLEDPSIPHGWNSLDTQPYVAPLEPPKPYSPPAAPLPVPISMQVYQLVTTVMTWPSATDAANRTKAATTIPPGKYQLLKTGMNGMLYVTKLNDSQQRKFWINPADNVIEPPKPVLDPSTTGTEADTSWKATYQSFNPDRKPVKYVLLQDYNVRDFGGNGQTRLIKQYTEMSIYGWFTFTDGKRYGRLKLTSDTEWKYYYGIPLDSGLVELEQKLYDPTSDTADRLALHHPTPYDKFISLGASVDAVYSKAIKTIDGIFGRKH